MAQDMFRTRMLELLEDDELNEALCQKAEELRTVHRKNGTWNGDSLSATNCSAYVVSKMLEVHMPDGTTAAYWISASRWPRSGRAQRIDVNVKRFFHSSEDYWEEQLAAEPERRVVIGGVHYRLGKNGNTRHQFNGFGGRRFDIEFFDGRIVTTYDLWYQGQIPPKFRKQLSDNARWAKFIETVP